MYTRRPLLVVRNSKKKKKGGKSERKFDSSFRFIKSVYILTEIVNNHYETLKFNSGSQV